MELSYSGTKYHGWQSQPNAETVQDNIEKALSILLKYPTKIIGAGRTDTGVHAKQMFAHFDSDSKISCASLQQKLNAFLAKDIAIFKIHPVVETAHARFDAVARSYTYYIHQQKDPFQQDFSWLLYKELDIPLMQSAAKSLLFFEDFKSFSKTHTDVKTYLCDIQKIEWVEKNKALQFNITADRFLRNMVRAIVGTLINVGLHKITLDEFIEIVKARDRQKAGFSVPAHALFLTKIDYPKNIFI